MKKIDIQEMVFETLFKRKMDLKLKKHLHKIPPHLVEEADYKINILNHILSLMMTGEVWIETKPDVLKEEER